MRFRKRVSNLRRMTWRRISKPAEEKEHVDKELQRSKEITDEAVRRLKAIDAMVRSRTAR